MESNYDVKAWSSATSLGRRVFNHNYRMFGRELPGWTLLKAVAMHEGRGFSEMTYLWQNNGALERELVSVNVAEFNDWRAAQKHLLQVLEHCMRIDLPPGTNSFTAIGDVSMIARAAPSDVPAAAHFVRGNLVASINSVGSADVSVSRMAEVIDRSLLEPPTSVTFHGANAQVLKPESVAVKARTGAVLVKDLTQDRNNWIKAIVPDGEVRRKGKSLVYLTSQPGKKAVQLYAIGAANAGRARSR